MRLQEYSVITLKDRIRYGSIRVPWDAHSLNPNSQILSTCMSMDQYLFVHNQFIIDWKLNTVSKAVRFALQEVVKRLRFKIPVHNKKKSRTFVHVKGVEISPDFVPTRYLCYQLLFHQFN